MTVFTIVMTIILPCFSVPVLLDVFKQLLQISKLPKRLDAEIQEITNLKLSA